MADKNIYVGVQDALVHRKNLLMSSRDLITSLKNYERLKSIRTRKIETIFELRRIIEEIIVLNRKLHQYLPKTDLPDFREASVKMPQSVRSKADLLQRELDRIESRLKRLE